MSGAATRIRTGDLILTKDVLYQLSHSSVRQRIFPHDADYYIKCYSVCQYFFEKISTNLFQKKKDVSFKRKRECKREMHSLGSYSHLGGYKIFDQKYQRYYSCDANECKSNKKYAFDFLSYGISSRAAKIFRYRIALFIYIIAEVP